MDSFLRDPRWSGISGVLAIISLLLYLWLERNRLRSQFRLRSPHSGVRNALLGFAASFILTFGVPLMVGGLHGAFLFSMPIGRWISTVLLLGFEVCLGFLVIVFPLCTVAEDESLSILAKSALVPLVASTGVLGIFLGFRAASLAAPTLNHAFSVCVDAL